MPSKKIYFLLYAALFIAYIGGLFLQIMEVDAAQYAAMGMEMLKNKSYLKLFDGGVPYLDKPPLHVWLAALSFKIFGISDFAYRIPSFLASILAVYSTYRFARQWYSSNVANWSALILAACQAFFLFNQDVKTDNVLTSMVIFSIWQLSTFIKTSKPLPFILGFMGIGMAMLAKGPLGFMVPAAALGSHLLLQRDWKRIFNFRWLLGIPIILIVLSPFLVGLYQQWGTYGLRFFFWTQSFGRITGESQWNNHTDPFYFVHTFLWAFLPWTFVAVAAIYHSGKEVIKSKFRLANGVEGFTIGGFVVMFLALSLSKYKLPHYIFVLFPLAAIMTARWIIELWEHKKLTFKWLSRFQTGIYCLLTAGIMTILWLVFQPVNMLIFTIVTITAMVAIIVSIRGTNAFVKIIVPGVLIMAAVNTGLNFDFYKRLLEYQSSNKVGQIITSPPYDKIHFYYYCVHGCHSLNYYSRQIVGPMYPNTLDDTLSKYDIIVYADDAGRRQIINNYYKIVNGNEYENIMLKDYAVQALNFKFLNPKTRPDVVHKMYLLHLAKIEDCHPELKK